MENMESTENFAAAGEIYEGNETEVLAEGGMMKKTSDSEEERQGKMETGGSENEVIEEKSKCVVMMVGGYNRDKPPEDDCCPICFDAFHFPCRTSCGHWFCSSCILQHWGYSTNYEPCKCPICGRLIFKLVPESSVRTQVGEEVSKVLKDIWRFNRLALLLKALALPQLAGRTFQEYLNPMILSCVYNSFRLFGLLITLYHAHDAYFFAEGWLRIVLLFNICCYAVILSLYLEFRWIHRRRRLRRLADLQLMQMEPLPNPLPVHVAVQRLERLIHSLNSD